MIQTKNIELTIGATTIVLVFVEGGTFQMGGDRFDREKPIHTVTVPSFYISKYLMTQRLYKEIMGENPSKRAGENRPVERVSWDDTKVFIKKLHSRTELDQLPQKGEFRLPTEAEWEFAARGGIYSQGYLYSGSDDLKQVGWYRENSGGETKPVGLLQSNELDLSDMSGNVYEWCEDDWHKDYNDPDRPDDGRAWRDAPSRGADRVIRGGYSFNNPVYCRPAYRSDYSPDFRYDNVGFRLVFSPSYRKAYPTTHEQNRQEANE